MNPATLERFWARVQKSDGCWEWTGARTAAGGYGEIMVDGVPWRAHRLSWTLVNGPIADGARVLHRCDNPPCVRPEHLFLGSQAENVADMEAKGRARHPVGERHGNAKLTEEAVRSIRAAHRSGVTRAYLARQHGVGWDAIGKIVSGEMWAHVD